MKIKEIQTNLMYVTQDIICHGANTKGVAGAGVALLLRSKYPKSYKEYSEHCANNKPEDLLGTILVTTDKNKTIVHMFTQLDYGSSRQQVDYDALRKCFKTFNQTAKNMGWTEAAMPKIGSGLGGGNWDEIVKIIEEESTEFQPIVSIQSK